MNDQAILNDTLKFHGHRCWASVAGVRVGLAALRALDVQRSGGTQCYAIIETGEEHGGMCFGDGIQYTTGCTFGKGNLRKNPLGRLAVTLIDKRSDQAVRVSYKPTFHYPSCHGRSPARRSGLGQGIRGDPPGLRASRRQRQRPGLRRHRQPGDQRQPGVGGQ